MKNTILILILLLGFSNGGYAQERRSLTVEESIQIGLQNSKTLHASQSRAESSLSRIHEVNAARLPSLKLSAGYAKLSTVPPQQITGLPAPFPPVITLSPAIFNNYALKATLEQKLFTGFRLENNFKVARLSEEAARQDLTKDRSELIYTIRNAYWTLFKASEEKKVVDENIEQVKAHLKDAQNLLAQNMVTNNDVLKVQVQLSSTQLLQIDARNSVQLAMINLNNLIGLPLTTDIEIKSPIVHQPLSWDESNTLVGKAIQNRNDIKALEYRLKAGEASVSAAKSGWYPQASITGNYYYNRPNQRYFPLKDEFKNSWDLGVNITFDAWNWGTTKYQTQQAQSQVSQTKDALGLLKDGISLEVMQNYLSLQQAKEKIAVAKQSIELAEESYRITSKKYKEGLALTSDLLDAEVAMLVAKTAHTRALVDYELAQAKLLKAIGE